MCTSLILTANREAYRPCRHGSKTCQSKQVVVESVIQQRVNDYEMWTSERVCVCFDEQLNRIWVDDTYCQKVERSDRDAQK